jgi:hypothetical protein
MTHRNRKYLGDNASYQNRTWNTHSRRKAEGEEKGRVGKREISRDNCILHAEAIYVPCIPSFSARQRQGRRRCDALTQSSGSPTECLPIDIRRYVISSRLVILFCAWIGGACHR